MRQKAQYRRVMFATDGALSCRPFLEPVLCFFFGSRSPPRSPWKSQRRVLDPHVFVEMSVRSRARFGCRRCNKIPRLSYYTHTLRTFFEHARHATDHAQNQVHRDHRRRSRKTFRYDILFFILHGPFFLSRQNLSESFDILLNATWHYLLPSTTFRDLLKIKTAAARTAARFPLASKNETTRRRQHRRCACKRILAKSRAQNMGEDF